MATTRFRSNYTHTKPPRPVSEAGRERETFKYEPFLVNDFRFNDTGQLLASTDLVTSSDSVMTALAQIGVYHTGTEHAFVSLFDASHQYFVAEATPLTPLTPSLPSDDCPKRLMYCGTAIPRSHGICEHALYSADNSPSGRRHADAAELPISISADLASDPRFLSKTFCLVLSHALQYQFYAAVPIRTRAGIDIGTYCVLSPTQPVSWDDNSTQRLRSVSSAIMDHLLAKRAMQAQRRNERVTRGLGSFIEGKATLTGWQDGPNTAAYVDNVKSDEGMLDSKQQLIERRAQSAMETAFHAESPPVEAAITVLTRTMTSPTDVISGYFDAVPATSIKDELVKAPRNHESGHLPLRPSLTASVNLVNDEPADDSEDSAARIFSKAANIIRESFEVEGCLFFDVTLGSYRAESGKRALANRGGVNSGNSSSPTTSGSEDHFFMSPVAEGTDTPSDVLAFSTSQTSSLNLNDVLDPGKHVTKLLLAKLLRRYPDGMIFNYDAAGELQSSDYSEEDSLPDPVPRHKPAATPLSSDTTSHGTIETTPTSYRSSHKSSRLKEAASIHKAFPDARSVAFVPIWDSRRDRWLAGSFIYTLTPTRLFGVEAELSILKAFGKVIAANIHSLEAKQIEKAKSDTLGSLSHELRSPLHGIMLSTELLNDTDLSVFQSNAAHTIETCGRTLLDTIDHLLDYSRINSFGSKHQKSSYTLSPRMQQRRASTKRNPLGHKVLHTHIRLDSVIEEVVESVFAGFNFQYTSIKQLSQKESAGTDTAVHNWLDGAQALEQLGMGTIEGLAQAQTEPRLPARDVSIYLSIDPTCSWLFYSQAGAFRRIVMNLFGNSLKYTDHGFIHVSLRQEAGTGASSTKRSKEQRMVRLVVQDTGRGMGEDFLTHKLFRPFSQEDELASGTGLGLSIVKSTVSQLRGRIQVESSVGVGTTITVRLPLVPSSEIQGSIDAPDNAAFDNSVQELKGMRVRIMSLGLGQGGGEIGSRGYGHHVVQDICQRWLCLDVLGDEQVQQMAPDFVLWLDEDALQRSTASSEQLARFPNIVVCRDPFVAYFRYRDHESTGQGVFEYITQPAGPRKLAKSMRLAYERWMGLPKLVVAPAPALAPAPAPAQHLVPLRPHDSQNGEISRQSPVSEEGGPASQKNLTQQQDPMTDKILLVDDNHINLKVLSAYMTKLGWPYDVAVNGQEAVDAFMRDPGRFAGILMDISMPVMDGLEATRQIRAAERLHHNPNHDQYQGDRKTVAVLALTGLATDSAQQEAFASGVDAFLTKPVRLNVLQEMLESKLVRK